ncbi:hypothetical protein [Microbacterium invictum]|uniref:Uncharacterized protein n=1 Tax=Microbacterium invictum TaxID=515415 RepID=A0AA40VN59_9MICO|nr:MULTISPECIES: hypothetical protein [Microbacterium]MBB4141059.1 hypothetical protein [Microbacterium invictum]
MVTLLLDSTQLEVVLSPIERLLSFRKSSVRIERTHLRKVQLTDDAWTWLRGVPSPGTHVRPVMALGTWKSAGGDDFVVVRGRRPAAVIDLDGEAEFQRLVVTTRHGLALVQALRLETDSSPTDVIDIVTGAIPTPSGRGARAPRPATV